MSENAQGFFVTMELLMHAETASKAMEAVQNILTSLGFGGGMSKLKELNVEVRMSGSTKLSETAPALGDFQWSSTVETEESGS